MTSKNLVSRLAVDQFGFLIELLQNFLRANQLVIEYLAGDIQQLKDHLIADGVVDGGTLFARINDIPGPQAGKLLRNGGLIGANRHLQFIYAFRASSQLIEDGEAGGMRQYLEELGFEAMHRLIHIANRSYSLGYIAI